MRATARNLVPWASLGPEFVPPPPTHTHTHTKRTTNTTPESLLLLRPGKTVPDIRYTCEIRVVRIGVSVCMKQRDVTAEHRRLKGNYCLHLQGSIGPEDEGSLFLRNVGVSLSRDHKTHSSFVFRTRGIILRKKCEL